MLTHPYVDHLSLQGDQRQPLKVKVLLPAKLEGGFSLLDMQQVLNANAKGIVLIVARLIADDHACHQGLSHP